MRSSGLGTPGGGATSSAAVSVGSGIGVDHQPALADPAEQFGDVVLDVGAVVALAQHRGDVVEGALAVAQLEHLDRGVVQHQRSLGEEEHGLVADFVVTEADAGGERRPGEYGGHRDQPSAPGRVSPRSIASSCAQSRSVLKERAATARSWSARARQRSSVTSSAYWASRGASVSREGKYLSPGGAVPGGC